MAHDAKREAHDIPATYAPDGFVESGLTLALAALGVDELPTLVLVAADNIEK
jgi:hypothetical protein